MVYSSHNSSKKTAMIKAGQILTSVLTDLKAEIKVGITTKELDQKAQDLIHHYGGQVSFNKVPGYHWATCMSVNEVIVHGVPSHYRLKENDMLKLDIGVYLNGYHIDYGDSFYLGTPPPAVSRFMDVGRATLKKVILLAKANTHIGLVSQTIEQSIQGAGFQVIYNLTGHGVGKELHEDPLIPQFLEGSIAKTPRFQAGNAYALEIIYSMKDSQIRHANNDGWSLRTKTGSTNCCFENTVFIEPDQSLVIVN